jgi:hypothetical protein
MSKVRRFKTDEWVIYCQFPDSDYENLRNNVKRAVVLEVLKKDDIYDYRIFIDDGSSRIKKVKEKNLSPVSK